MGVLKDINEKEAFPEGCRVQVHDRYRFGSRDVTGTVQQHSTSNDGVCVDIDEEFMFLLAVEKSGVAWVRPQQLIRIQNMKGWSAEEAETVRVAEEAASKGLNFGDVMAGIKAGNAYTRKGWNGVGIWIIGQFPDEHSKMTQPYIYIVTNDLMSDNPDAVRGRVPWLASQTDMFAEDWVMM